MNMAVVEPYAFGRLIERPLLIFVINLVRKTIIATVRAREKLKERDVL